MPCMIVQRSVAESPFDAEHNKTNESQFSDLKSEHPAIFPQLFRFGCDGKREEEMGKDEVDERLALIQQVTSTKRWFDIKQKFKGCEPN